MPISQRERDAVKAAQMVMGLGSSQAIVADGWWGSYTQSVYNKLNPVHKQAVDTVLTTLGFNAQRLKTAFDAEKLTSPRSKASFLVDRVSRTSSQSEMAQLVKRVALREGVPPETALRIAYLESKFDAKAVSPTGAKGLFQFTSIAVRDVAQRANYQLTNPFDGESNATAGMKYIKLVARDLGIGLGDVVKLYMGFNIGPTAARKYLSGRIDDSVRKAISLQAYGGVEVYGDRLSAKILGAPLLA